MTIEKPVIECDYVIIGAGIAGTVLRRFLQSEDVVLLEPRPGRHKIGESIIPEHHQHPVMRELLPGIRSLPTYSDKQGTVFIAEEGIASFPLPRHVEDLAFHIGRSDLERHMHKVWGTPITRDAAKRVDVEAREVETTTSILRARKQIIDCSGPAMVVARTLGDVNELWPVWCRFTYVDITGIDDERFYRFVEESGRPYRRYDAPNWQLLPGSEDASWRPSHATVLSQLRRGEWTWQIPLANSSLLSFGVVSRHGPVSEERLFELIEETHLPVYSLARRSRGKGMYDRVYVRNSFARHAGTPATMNYILLSDAAAFADPVYSVGTGLAVNKAIELAALLNDGGWTPEKCARWCTDYKQLIERAVSAFDLWYSGAVVEDSEAATEVQRGFLVGNAFQVGVVNSYATVLVDAKGPAPLDESGERVSAFPVVEHRATDVSSEVGALLPASDGGTAGWTFEGALRVSNTLSLTWTHPVMPALTVSIELDSDATRYFRRVGRFSLSFRNLPDGPYPLDAPVIALFDALGFAIERDAAEWERIVGGSVLEGVTGDGEPSD